MNADLPEFDRLRSDPRFARAVEEIERIGPLDGPVLLLTPGGLGNSPRGNRIGASFLAERIHDASGRGAGPRVHVACASLPETLLESELFGHEQGAFSSAIARRKGRFEMVHRGTIFLDEVGSASPAIQRKVARVLENGEFERMGGSETLHVDVRVVASTSEPPATLLPELLRALAAHTILIPPPS